MPGDTREKAAFIRSHSKEIADYFIAVGHKKFKTAKKFGITTSGLDRALFIQGLEEYVAPCFIRKWKHRPEPTQGPTKAEPLPSASQIAAELLRQVVDAIRKTEAFDAQAAVLQKQLRDLREENAGLEAKLKKAIEEKERCLRVHNTIVREAQGRLPSIEEVVRVLRREHRPGQIL